MTNEKTLYEFFAKNFPFNKDGLEELIESFEERHYQKGEIILKPKSIEKYLKFIKSGFVREYYTTDEKDVNINFYEANEFGTDLISFFNDTQTKKWQQCLTEVKSLIITKTKLNDLLEKYSCSNSIIQTTFQNVLGKKESHERKKITKSTDERYRELLIKKPNWLKHIPQYHIASYLNITPETLSRIRNRTS